MNSNIKQRLNDDKKIELNPKIKENLGNVLSLDEQSLAQLTYVLELPDEVFDAIYPSYQKQMGGMFDSPEAQAAIISSLRAAPIDDVESLRNELPILLHELTDDESLSQNKKDLIKSIFQGALDIVEEIVAGGGREFVTVKITKLNPDAIIPTYAHPTDCGADVAAVAETKIEAGETKIVPTGLAVAIPAGYEIQIRPRSGLSLKSSLRVANAPGTIDADYRGEVGIIMTNTGETAYVIDKGIKIAQMVIAPTPRIKWKEVESVEDLGSTERGAGGFGSTTAAQG